MKLIQAARFAGITITIDLLVLFLLLGDGLNPSADWDQRSTWLAANGGLWMAGGWLTLLGIFAWMVLLVAFMYTYSPGHRVATMLQSGLVLISAILLIASTIIWMNLLPGAASPDWASFIDGLGMTFGGAGLFMGGGVTAWIALDMVLMEKLPRSWMAPGMAAGLLAVPAPFLLPTTTPLLLGLALFIVWCGIIGVRSKMPPAYPEFSLGE